MGLPSEWMKVGPKWYQLLIDRLLVNEAEEQLGHFMDGRSDHSEDQVVLKPGHGEEHNNVILCHETVHGWLRQIMHEVDMGREEAMASQLAYLILPWVRDNPDLIACGPDPV